MKKTTKSKCKCFVNHAVNPEHRKQIADNLEYFRKIGDTFGMFVSMAQLQACPSQTSKSA